MRTRASACGIAAIVTGVLAVTSALARAQSPLPHVVREASDLLGWSSRNAPRVEVVPIRPGGVSPLAAGWVWENEDGCAIPVIYVAAQSHIYRQASEGDYPALVELASILAHERWHIEHGPNEVEAYIAQLSVMERLKAPLLAMLEIQNALWKVQEQQKRNAQPNPSGADRKCCNCRR